MRSLGNLGSYFGKVFGQGAKEGEKLTGAFERWTDKVNKGFKADSITGLVTDAKALGRFLVAGGRSLKAFFGGGREAGRNFLNDMTGGLNRWTKKLTGEGADGLKEFFGESVKNTKALWSVVAPVGAAFLTWAVALTPVATGVLSIVSGVAKLVAGILRGVEAFGNLIPGVQGVSKALFGTENAAAALGATIAVLWGVGKGAAFIAMLQKGIGLLKQMRTAAIGVGVAQTASTAASGAAGAAGAAAAARGAAARGAGSAAAGAAGAAAAGAAGAKAADAAKKVGLLRTAAVALIPAIGTMGASMATVATGGLALLAAGVVVGGYKLLTMKTNADKLKDSLKAADLNTKNFSSTTKASMNNMAAAGAATRSYREDVKTTAAAKKRLAAAEKESGKNSSEYQAALGELNGALNQRQTSEAALNKTSSDQAVLAYRRIQQNSQMISEEGLLTDAKAKQAAAQRDINLADRTNNSGLKIDAQKRLAAANSEVAARTRSVAAASREADAAARRLAVGNMNYQRALQGMIPLAGRAAAALGNLAKKNPNVAAKISVKYADPKDAGAVAKRAQSAFKSGVSVKTVMKIVADSSNAEQALRKIKAVQLRAKIQKILESGKGDVIGAIAQIGGKKLATKVQKILANDSSAKSKVNALIALGIPPKTARMLGNNSDALAKARQANSQVLKTLTQAIRRAFDAGSGPTPPSITQTVRRVYTGGGGNEGGTTGGRASGRGPGPSKNTLIGEGRADEYVVNPDKGTVFKTQGPSVTALDRGDYVIPTEPRYRARGRELLGSAARSMPGGLPGLADIAKDLGMEAFGRGRKGGKKGGKKTAARGKGKPAAKGKGKTQAPLPEVVDKYSGGGVPTEQVEKELSTATSWHNSRQSRIRSLEKQLIKARNKAKGASPKKKKGQKQSPREKAYGKVRELKTELGRAKDGDEGKNAPDKAKGTFKSLQARLTLAQNNKKKVEKFNEDIEEFKSQANQQGSIMERNATLFNKTNDPKYLDGYKAAKALREGFLGQLKNLFAKATKLATPKSALARENAEESEKFNTELVNSQNEDLPAGITSDAASSADADTSLSGYMATLGQLADFNQRMYNRSAAKLNNLKDDPNTAENEAAASLGDDEAAQSSLVDFYQNFLGALRQSGAPVATQTEAVDALVGAKDELASIKAEIAGDTGGGSGPVASQSLARDTARYEALRQYGSNAFSGEALNAAGIGAGSSGASGLQGGARAGRALSAPTGTGSGSMDNTGTNTAATGGRSVVINNAFAAPPPDPTTWSAGVAFEIGGGL